MFKLFRKRIEEIKKDAARLDESKDGVEATAGAQVKSQTLSAEKRGAPRGGGLDRGVEEVFSEGRGKRIKEKDLEDLLWKLEIALLEADVAQEVATCIIEDVKENLLSVRLRRGARLDEAVEIALKDAIKKVLTAASLDFDQFIKTAEKPVVVMFVGVNGSGKTTAIAKIAYRIQKMGMSCVIAAGDTFRAGAIEQLQKHANNLGVRLIKHKQGSDPAAVAYDAIQHARARGRDVVLIDTAGRMQTNINLMEEMKKIKRVAQPDFVIFVGDALAGNDAVEQAEKFNEAVGVDGVILTKIDADAKGGAALSIAYAIGKPILFVSTGQKYEEFQKFDPDWMVSRLFGEV